MKDTNLFKDVFHKDLNGKSGIYKITCKHHSYIGSSVNIYYRLKDHSSELRRSKHDNRFMTRCYNKYGEDAFLFEVLEYGSRDQKRLVKREKYWIDKLNPDINSERNPITKETSEKSKKLISKTLKRRYANGEISPTNMKAILVYNLDGTFVGEYISCSEASRQLNLNFKKVSLVALGKQAYHRGYTFKYK